MLYAFCLTVARDLPVCSAISLDLPRGKSLFSSLTSSSDHATQPFFLLFAFFIAVILLDFSLNGNDRFGCGDVEVENGKGKRGDISIYSAEGGSPTVRRRRISDIGD